MPSALWQGGAECPCGGTVGVPRGGMVRSALWRGRAEWPCGGTVRSAPWCVPYVCLPPFNLKHLSHPPCRVGLSDGSQNSCSPGRHLLGQCKGRCLKGDRSLASALPSNQDLEHSTIIYAFSSCELDQGQFCLSNSRASVLLSVAASSSRRATSFSPLCYLSCGKVHAA